MIDKNTISELIPNQTYNVFIGVLVFFIFMYAIKLIKRILSKYLQPKLKNNENVYVLIYRIISSLIFFIGCLLALSIAIPDFSATNIINLLGITSVAIGFAFKDILQNFLSGMLLLIEKPFKIGDSIISENYAGIVRDIRIRATILKTISGERIVIPNSKLFTAPITVNNAYRLNRIEVNINIPITQDIDFVTNLISEVFAQSITNNKNTIPRIEVIGFTKNKTIIKLTWWYDNKEIIKDQSLNEILTAINKSFNQNNIYSK